jgi:hypothetical protein
MIHRLSKTHLQGLPSTETTVAFVQKEKRTLKSRARCDIAEKKNAGRLELPRRLHGVADLC